MVGLLAPVHAAASRPTDVRRAAQPGSARPGGPARRARELVGRAPGMRYECARDRSAVTLRVPAGLGRRRHGAERSRSPLLRARSSQAARPDRLAGGQPGRPRRLRRRHWPSLSFGGCSAASREITERFDIVGFDPRGVARSSPVKCISDADLDAIASATTPTRRRRPSSTRWSRSAGGSARGCGQKYGDRRSRSSAPSRPPGTWTRSAPPSATTKLTYLGYSYGTLLGAMYAQLFPRQVRALVLDGAVDPRQDCVAGSESQAEGLRAGVRQLRRWCAGNAGRCPIAPDARAAVTDGDRQGRRYLPGARRRRTEATAGWVFYAVVSSLYTEAALAGAGPRDRPAAPGRPDRRVRASPTRTPTATRRPLLQPVRRQPRGQLRRRGRAAGRRDRSAQLQSQWRTKYPLFGAAARDVGMLTCVDLAGEARPVPDRRGRRRAADRGGRHHRRPGHAVRADREAGRDARRRAACSPGRARGTPRTRRRAASGTRSTPTSCAWRHRATAPPARCGLDCALREHHPTATVPRPPRPWSA